MKATYLGLELDSPIVVSSSPYTATLANIEKCAAAGAGAVVLKSIFEEQIMHHAASLEQYSDSPYGDAGDYLQRYLGEDYKAGFLQLIADARRATRIPVIASINCVAAGEEWIEYAAAMARAGASALELNIFIQPVDAARSSQELERLYVTIAQRVCAEVKIPVSVKLAMRFTNVVAMAAILCLVIVAFLVLPEGTVAQLSRREGHAERGAARATESGVLGESEAGDGAASSNQAEGASTADRIERHCAAVARDFGLTPRESEVIVLLAYGRTLAIIARDLHIAQGTARTHIENIYRKLDVHKQQELIDLVENHES